MELVRHPFVAAAAVAVLSASLLHATPAASYRTGDYVVHLAAAGDVFDVVGPIDAALNISTGADALTPGVDAVSAASSDALAALTDLQLADPAFWQLFWEELVNPDAGASALLLLIGAFEELPVVGPLLASFGAFVVFPASLLLAYAWNVISDFLGIEPYAAEAAGTGVQGVADAALTGVVDAALPADATAVFAGLTSVLGVAADTLDATNLAEGFSAASDFASILDVGAVIDPAAVTDAGAMLGVNAIPDLGEIVASLVP